MGLLAILGGNRAVKTKTVTKQTLPTDDDHNGIEVVANPDSCCEAARDITGQRFLKKDTPMLPLNGCDAQPCTCKYERYDDRRTEARRLSDVGYDMAGHLHPEENRSDTSSGRRDDD